MTSWNERIRGTGKGRRRQVHRIARWVAVLIVAVLAVIGLASLFDGTDDEPAATSSATDEGTTGPGVAAAPELIPQTGFGFIDLFLRSGDDLGAVPSGVEWLEIAGDWAVDAGTAMVRAAPPEGASIAAINLGTTDATFQVTMPTVVAGSGIVFRFRNAFNYWAVQAAPAAGTWSVRRVVDGNTIEVTTLGLSRVDDGSSIGVRTDGDRIVFFVNGVRTTSIDDPALANSTRVGLIGFGDEVGDARWANVVAIGASRTRIPVAPDAPDGEETEAEADDAGSTDFDFGDLGDATPSADDGDATPSADDGDATPSADDGDATPSADDDNERPGRGNGGRGSGRGDDAESSADGDPSTSDDTENGADPPAGEATPTEDDGQ